MTQKKWTFALKPKRSTTYGLSTELLLISPFQKCLNINIDKNHISFARSGTALLCVCTCTELGREHNFQGKARRRHAPPGHRPRVHRPRPRGPPHSDRAGSANARESHLGFHVCHVPKDQDRLESRKLLALTGDCVAPEHLQSCRGQGSAAGFGPLLEAFVIGYNPRHSAFGRGGGGAQQGRGVAQGAGQPRALASGGSRRFGARGGRARAAGTRVKVLGGAAGGTEAQALQQEPRPAPAAALPAVGVPAPPVSPRPAGPHTPRLLQRWAQWPHARMPRAAAATAAAAAPAVRALALAAAAAAPGHGEVRGAPGRGSGGPGPAVGVRPGRRALGLHLSRSRRASPILRVASLFGAGPEAALGGPGGRAGGAGWRGSAGLGGSPRGAASRLIPPLQGAA